MRRYKKIVPVLVASMTLSLFQPVSMNWASADTASVTPAVPAVPAATEVPEPTATDVVEEPEPSYWVAYPSTAKPATTPGTATAATEKPATTPEMDAAATSVPETTPVGEEVTVPAEEALIFETSNKKEEYAVVTGYRDAAKKATSLTIPAEVEINGEEYPVKKIDDKALAGLSNLRNLTLPEGLETIHDSFINGTAIKEITIPSTVKDMRNAYGAFSMNTTIEKVVFAEGMLTIPYAALSTRLSLNKLVDANGRTGSVLKKVVIPSTVTKIDKHAFSGQSALPEIKLPDGLTFIGDRAFQDCASLTSLKLPEGLETIHASFINGTAIKEITIPSTVTEMWNGDGAFCKNTTIEKIVFAEGMLTIPYAALSTEEKSEKEVGADGRTTSVLKEVVIPSTVTKIDQGAFRGQSTLPTLTLPDGLTKIGDHAFENCSSLSRLELSDSVTNIGTDVFSGCSLKLACGNKWSYAYRYAFLNDLADSYKTDVRPESSILNEKGNSYTIGVSNNSYTQYKVNYSVKENKFRDYDGGMVVVHFMQDVDIQNKNIYVDGKLTSNYRIDSNTMRVPVSKDNGSIVFYVSSKQGKLPDSMALYENDHYNADKVNWKAYNNIDKLIMINTVSNDRNLILNAEYNAEKDVLVLSGEARPEEKVTLTLSTDSTPVKVKSNKIGTYRTEIENPAFGKNGKINITAEVIRALTDKEPEEGMAAPAERICAYQTVQKNAVADIQIEKFMMYYPVSSRHIPTNMLTDQKFISYNPSKNFIFNIKLKDRSKVLGVYVVAESGSEREELKAVYNEETGMYAVRGKFSFLPNKIGLEFSTPYEPQYEWSEEDAAVTSQRAGMSNISYKLTGNEDGSYLYTLSVDGQEDNDSMVTVKTNSLSKVVTQGAVTTASAIMNYIAAKGYNVGTDLQASVMAQDGRAFLVIRADNGEKLAVFTLDIPKALNEKYMAQAGTTSGAAVGDAAQVFTDLEAIQTMIREITAQSDEDAELQELEMVLSDETAGILAQRLKDGNDINVTGLYAARDYVMDLLAKAAMGSDDTSSKLIAAGKTITHRNVEDVIANSSKNEEYRIYGKTSDDKKADYFRFSKNRYGLDPSGIVYEAVPSNPLSGVTATLYYRADENSEAVKWDAENYDQINPQITDETGAYQWDVVNGQWQVVFTKDGYEEARSEWLPVPPVQLGINIPMISKAAPKLVQSEGDVERLKLTYDKYLDISTITADNVTVQTASGKLVEVTAVEAGEKESTSLNADDANAAEYSKEIVISGDFAKYKGQKLIVSVGEGVKSYAGTSVTQKDAEIQLTGVLSLTVDKQECSMIMGESERVQVKVDGMENAEIVTGASFGLADVRDTGLRTEDGAYIYEIKANSVGEFEVTFGVKGTDLSAAVSVNVEARTLKKNGVIITSDISKEYDGKAVSEPAYVTSGSGVVTIEYMQGKTVLAEAPKLPGKYTVRVNVAADEEYGSAYAERAFEITGEVPVTNPPAQTPTGSATTAPTQTPTGTATTAPTKTPVPSATATTEPTATVAPTATTVPTVEPTEAPTEEPTQAPTKKPEGTATAAPTQVPTTAPTQAPTAAPTKKPAAAKKSFVVKGVTYKVTGKNTVSYAKAKKGVKGNVVIPATVKNGSTTYKVTSLANNVFKGNKKITKVVIGANITKIGKNAFNKCAKLKQIVIKTTKLTAGSVGKNAFAGIHKKAVIKVPKAQKKSYTKLLKKSGVKGSMKIKA